MLFTDVLSSKVPPISINHEGGGLGEIQFRILLENSNCVVPAERDMHSHSLACLGTPEGPTF